MAKEKKAYIEQEKKDLTFYYEIVGILSLLIPTIALARLGMVGFYLMLTFRIFFGDWSFAFLIGLALYGLRSLIYHKPMNLKNMRAIGILLLMIAVLTLSHFPMHDYVRKYGTNYLGLTFELYLDYFKNYHEGMIVGGGIIGCSFFYLFYSLFSNIGTVIISFILIFVGIAFTTRHTVKEFVGIFAGFFVGVYKRTGKVLKTIKYDIERGEKIDIKRKRKKVTLDRLTSFSQVEYPIVEEKHAEGVKRTIANVLNNMNIFFNEITYTISYHHTSYFIHTLAIFSLEAFHLKLKRVLSEDFLIKKKRSNNSVVIEVNNIHPRVFDLKKHYSFDKKMQISLDLLLGIHGENEILVASVAEVNNILLVGSTSVANFINSLIIQVEIKNGSIPYHVTILDAPKILFEWQDYERYHTDVSILKDIKTELDRRLDVMHQNSFNTSHEYNNSIHGKNPLSQELVIICGINSLLESTDNKEKLLYLLQIGMQCGYNFICWLNDDVELPTVINSMFNDKLIFNSEFNVATKILGFPGAHQLNPESEAFYLHKDEINRISVVQTPNENVQLFKKQKKG